MPLLLSLGTCSASADRLIAYALVEEKEQRVLQQELVDAPIRRSRTAETVSA